MGEEEEELKAEVKAGVGCILLNRPKKLNCLSLSMIRKMTKVLKEWDTKESGVKVIVVRGSGRAFCSGGDVVSLYHGDADMHATYIKEEYSLDLLVHRLSVPYIAVMDGITMGGGCGISVNGRYRVATKRTVMAMPECSIGLVPDVGAGRFLPKLDNHLGLFLGLTGYRLEGRDALSSGLATHYFSSKEGWDGLDRLEGELTKVVAMDTFTNSEVRGVLDKLFEHKRSRLSFNAMLEMINQVFGLGSLADIMEGLEALGWSAGEETDLLRFARNSLSRMKAFSPTSLALTFDHLRDREKKKDLEESLAAEQRMQQRCLGAPDFREGIRCTLLEKEKGEKPRWIPGTLKQATKEHLSAYLRPLGPAVALQEDGEAAWATALGMGVQDYHLAKQGKIINQSY